MSAVPARAGQHKMFQDIFLNQGAEQLCLPAQARYKDDSRISDQLIPICLPAQTRYKDDSHVSDQLIPRTAVSVSSG